MQFVDNLDMSSCLYPGQHTRNAHEAETSHSCEGEEKNDASETVGDTQMDTKAVTKCVHGQDCSPCWRTPRRMRRTQTSRPLDYVGRIPPSFRSIRRRARAKSAQTFVDLIPRRLDFDSMGTDEGAPDGVANGAKEEGKVLESSSGVSSNDCVDEMLEGIMASQRERFRRRWNFDIVDGPLPGPWIWESLSE